MKASASFGERDDRSALDGLGEQLLGLIAKDATAKQWADWLRVPLEIALRRSDGDLVSRLLVAGSVARAGSGRRESHALLSTIAARTCHAGAADAMNGPRGCSNTAISPKPVDVDTGAENVVASNESGSPGQKSALHQAVCDGNAAAVEDLLHAGASARTKGHKGSTLLHRAVAGGNADIVRALLAKGADVDKPDGSGVSPLRLAVTGGKASVVGALLEAGAGETASQQAGSNGTFALVTSAARRDNVEVLRALSSHGVDVDTADADSYTAVHHAAMRGRSSAVHALAEAGADATKANPLNGSTPLHWAARKGYCDAMVALLRHGADVNAQDGDGRTPLHRACSIGEDLVAVPAVELLLIWGADDTIVNKRGHVPAELVFQRAEEGREGGTGTGELLQLVKSRPEDREWCRRGLLAILCRAKLGPHGLAAVLGRLVSLEEERLFDLAWGKAKRRSKTKRRQNQAAPVSGDVLTTVEEVAS